MGHPALRKHPEESRPFTEKKQPNKPQHTKKARLTACLFTFHAQSARNTIPCHLSAKPEQAGTGLPQQTA
jgi:hypothetical protein